VASYTSIKPFIHEYFIEAVERTATPNDLTALLGSPTPTIAYFQTIVSPSFVVAIPRPVPTAVVSASCNISTVTVILPSTP
jgi:hypothetical protein